MWRPAQHVVQVVDHAGQQLSYRFAFLRLLGDLLGCVLCGARDVQVAFDALVQIAQAVQLGR